MKNYPHGKSIYIKRSILKKLHRVCVRCGETDENKLVVDHINRDSTDNRLDNLQVLCRNCHLEKTPDSPYIAFLKYDAARCNNEKKT
ncbi:HNH endonuclease [Candidatus Bathyarchaeota archaeon]|nr:HNH endonuclease [Candidatus Bathyarchaeota archaeon]